MKEGYAILYSTLNVTEAHVIRFLLEHHGIASVIENEGMNPLFGMVSAKDAQVRVMVPEERLSEARALLQEASSIDLSQITLARCRKCGEMVCDRFDYCWNCMANMKTGEPLRDGAAGPDTKKRGRLPVLLYYTLIGAFLAVVAYYLYLFFRGG
jgi:hypothetical protein